MSRHHVDQTQAIKEVRISGDQRRSLPQQGRGPICMRLDHVNMFTVAIASRYASYRINVRQFVLGRRYKHSELRTFKCMPTSTNSKFLRRRDVHTNTSQIAVLRYTYCITVTHISEPPTRLPSRLTKGPYITTHVVSGLLNHPWRL
jgi:hypothetical protein